MDDFENDKNIPAPQILKIIQKIFFLYWKTGKTTSRWFFWQKLKNQNFAFFKFFCKIFFKNGCASASIFFYLFKFVKYRSSAFTWFLSWSKIIEIGFGSSIWKKCKTDPVLQGLYQSYTISNRQHCELKFQTNKIGITVEPS